MINTLTVAYDELPAMLLTIHFVGIKWHPNTCPAPATIICQVRSNRQIVRPPSGCEFADNNSKHDAQ